jgi:hypothetical protein
MTTNNSKRIIIKHHSCAFRIGWIFSCKKRYFKHWTKKNILYNLLYFYKNNKIPKLALANGLWITIAPKMLPNLTMVEETLIARYHFWTILFKLRYTNKGGIIGQHALKGNIVSFAQNFEHAIEVLDELPLSLESLSDFVFVHFVNNTHPSIEVVKSCKFLYVRKYVVTLWLTWMKSNHIEYRCTTINMHKLNMLPNDNIPNLMMRSMSKSTNIN